MERDVRNASNTIVIDDSVTRLAEERRCRPGADVEFICDRSAALYDQQRSQDEQVLSGDPDAATSDATCDLGYNPLGSTNWRYRVFPAPRNRGKAGFVFADGHAETKSLREIDDFNGDGVYDNGYWNGTGNTDPSQR